MNAVAHVLWKSRWLPGLIAGLLLITPPVGLVGAAALGLVALRSGQYEALLQVGVAAAVAALMNTLAGQHWAIAVVMVTVGSLPVVAAAGLVRWRQSFAMALQAVLVTLFVMVIVVVIGVDDITAYWREAFSQWLDGLPADSSQQQQNVETLKQGLPYGIMTGLSGAYLFLYTTAGLCLARSWQARVVNAGGFRRDFHGLRLGNTLAWFTLLVILAAATGSAMSANGALVLAAGWFIQGLAVVHSLRAHFAIAPSTLWGFYTALVLIALFAPSLLVVLPGLGLADQLFKLRQKVAARPAR